MNVDRAVLALALLIQAALLLPRLDLLPVWADEQQTLTLVAASPGDMLGMLRTDFHPPLYFLALKAWVWWLPQDWPLIVQVRLASVAALLLATFVLDRLWLRERLPRARVWFLLLWVSSPALLLYGRMGRSYAVQILLFAVTAALAVRWLERATVGRTAALSVATLALLYTHYVPGVATAVAVLACGAYRIARGESDLGRRLALFTALVATGYLPWMAVLADAVGRRLGAEVPPIVPVGPLDHAIRVAFTLASFTVGETLSPAAFAAAVLLVPAAVWMAARGSLAAGAPAAAVIALLVAYLMVAHHVVISMTPSRLLFLLPCYLLLIAHGCGRARRAGPLLVAALIVISGIGTASYYRQRDFLNQAYVMPSDRIAEDVRARWSVHALLVVDAANLDATPVLAALEGSVAVATLDRAAGASVQRRIDRPPRHRVLFLRHTRDRSPGQASSALRRSLAAQFTLTERLTYLPLGATEQRLLRHLRREEPPDHVLELLVFDRTPSSGGALTRGRKF